MQFTKLTIKLREQTGQTLLETIIAVFILVTALTAGVGLGIYAFSNSAVSQSEITASNLAREGVEAVRLMRDSNWLASDAKGASWDLTSCADIGGRFCYPKAYQKVSSFNNYDLNSGNQRAVFDAPSVTWSLDNTTSYDLYLQANGTYTHTISSAGPMFARMINITFNSNAPYSNQNSNQEMIVKSVVAWRGKGCAVFNSNQDLLALASPCKLMVEEHMTNWKDYK